MSTNATETSHRATEQYLKAGSIGLESTKGHSRRLSREQELAILADLEERCADDGLDLELYAPLLLKLQSS